MCDHRNCKVHKPSIHISKQAQEITIKCVIAIQVIQKQSTTKGEKNKAVFQSTYLNTKELKGSSENSICIFISL